MDDGAVAALEYERECRRCSEEMFTWSHRGVTYYIFWTGPRDFMMENPTGASQLTGTPVMQSIALMVLCA